MSGIDMPDMKYGFWVALGAIAAFMLLAAVRVGMGKVGGKNG